MHLIQSGGYTFALVVTTIPKFEKKYKFVSLIKQPFPCISIAVSADGSAVLEALNFYKSCSIKEKSLESGLGTIYMLKVALAYVLAKHKKLKEVELQDETFVNIPEKPLISGRRIIMGQLGWYEEHLKAVPTGRTRFLVKFFRDPESRRTIQDKIPIHEGRSWWTATNVMKLCELIKCPGGIIGSTWKIDRATINGYNIEFSEQQSKSDTIGGSHIAGKVKRILKGARGFPYEETLRAKYRYHDD